MSKINFFTSFISTYSSKMKKRREKCTESKRLRTVWKICQLYYNQSCRWSKQSWPPNIPIDVEVGDLPNRLQTVDSPTQCYSYQCAQRRYAIPKERVMLLFCKIPRHSLVSLSSNIWSQAEKPPSNSRRAVPLILTPLNIPQYPNAFQWK